MFALLTEFNRLQRVVNFRSKGLCCTSQQFEVANAGPREVISKPDEHIVIVIDCCFDKFLLFNENE